MRIAALSIFALSAMVSAETSRGRPGSEAKGRPPKLRRRACPMCFSSLALPLASNMSVNQCASRHACTSQRCMQKLKHGL